MTFFTNPIVQGALTGFLAAFIVDLEVWKSWGDVAFNFRTASFRWVVGLVSGALAAAGFGQL